MKLFKGFDKNLKCRDFQYEIGGEYEEERAELCEAGFHACKNPIDVFGYYPPSDSRYCEVELDGLNSKTSEDSKRVGRRIKIGAEIGIKGIVDAFIKFTMERIDFAAGQANTGNQSAATNTGYRSAATNTGNRSAATNTGYQSAATNTGNQSAATNTGYQSAATNTGDQSAATNTGYRSAATNTGNRSAATNTGYQSAATNTGYRSAATNTGYYSAATNTGNQSAAEVKGAESIAIATGIESKAAGAIGCYIVLAEWEIAEDSMWHIKAVRSHKVDGKVIKPGVFYKLKNGKFVKAEE